MTIAETILTPILLNISQTDKWQRDFLVELFTTLFSRQGRFNFENLTRYSKYNELTHRRQFSKYLDWFSLNKALVDFNSGIYIGVIDCSFISKSGKKTFGIDYASQTNFGQGLIVKPRMDWRLASWAVLML